MRRRSNLNISIKCYYFRHAYSRLSIVIFYSALKFDFKHYRKEESMGTTQNPLELTRFGLGFSRFMPKGQKSSFGNQWGANFQPPFPKKNSSDSPYRLQTVKAFFQGYSDGLGSFWTSRKNQKSGRENREELKAEIGTDSAILAKSSQMSPSYLQFNLNLITEDYGLEYWKHKRHSRLWPCL